jgi:CheY-like chemotaxis protein
VTVFAPGPAVLVIDDDEDILELCSLQLRQFGFEVLQARSGREAIEIAKFKHPDAVVLDFRLPDMNGIEVLDAIKGDSLIDCPVIMLSAYLEPHDEAMAKGAADYLPKPMLTTQLARSLQSALYQAAKRRQRARRDQDQI